MTTPKSKSVKPNKERLKVASTKKDEGYTCVNCGYTGHGVADEETHAIVCPECGANLEENDILKFSTPNSYEGEDDDFNDGSNLDETLDHLIKE